MCNPLEGAPCSGLALEYWTHTEKHRANGFLRVIVIVISNYFIVSIF